MIKNVSWSHSPSSLSSYLTLEVELQQAFNSTLMDVIYDKIINEIAAEYVKQHGAEILKNIQAQTVDAKVIQKVVANLRKELKDETH